MKPFFIIAFSIFCFSAIGQQQDVEQLLETARGFERQGDLDNAVLVLTKAQQQNPTNFDLTKELSFVYYLQHDNEKSITEIKKILDNVDADEQTFQIASLIYVAKQDFKEAEKVYKKGLAKFPQSGMLYSGYGEMLYSKDASSKDCIKAWEKGIEVDPNFSGNYYNASRFYGTISNNLWCLLYGETFVNLESYSTRTVEVKNILLDVYKRWFGGDNRIGNTSFEQQVSTVLNKQSSQTSFGITPEALIAIRARFILDWFATENKTRPPFRLFDYQRQLLQEGLFEAYNQWLFGSVANMDGYQNWVANHTADNTDFSKFQRGRVFKIPTGQYYNAASQNK